MKKSSKKKSGKIVIFSENNSYWTSYSGTDVFDPRLRFCEFQLTFSAGFFQAYNVKLTAFTTEDVIESSPDAFQIYLISRPVVNSCKQASASQPIYCLVQHQNGFEGFSLKGQMFGWSGSWEDSYCRSDYRLKRQKRFCETSN